MPVQHGKGGGAKSEDGSDATKTRSGDEDQEWRRRDNSEESGVQVGVQSQHPAPGRSELGSGRVAFSKS